MAQSWSAILHIDGIGVHDNFFELGGDSLQATILLNRLQEHLGESIQSHVLFQVQSINDLADYLREHCPGAVRRHYPHEAVAGAEPSGVDGAAAIPAWRETSKPTICSRNWMSLTTTKWRPCWARRRPTAR